MDALIAHSEHGADELRALVGDPTRVHRIPHGAFNHLARPAGRAAAARGARRGRGPGDPLLRPRPSLQGRRRAARGVPRARGCRALGGRDAADGPGSAAARWPSAAGRRSASSTASSPTRRSRPTSAAPTSSCCPYRQIEQSGVLYTALAFGNADRRQRGRRLHRGRRARRALRLVPPGDPAAARRGARQSCSPTRQRASDAGVGGRRRRDRALLVGGRSPRRTLDVYRRLIAG